jgi:membrane-bound serine protease (ClpP class)
MCWLSLNSCKCLLFIVAWILFLPVAALADDAPAASPVMVLETTLAAAISPAQADMLDAALARARDEDATLLLLRLDTPGGSIEVMRRMVQAILNAPVPVVVWVAPSGARAASAGVFLVAAASVAAMAPQTSIGSASPVGPGGGDIDGTMSAKIKNDLESLLRGMAVSHGRNVDWYIRSVSKAANIDAMEAAKIRVVDCIAVDREDLLTQIGRRGLPTRHGLARFGPDQVRVTTFEPGWRHEMLTWMLDPQIAYMLLLVGMAGLFFELTTPGAILPGVLGSLSLLLALYALSVLPTNATGLLLLMLGAVFFLLEVYVTSYGLLAVAGLISLFLGSLLLFRGAGLGGLPLSLILPTVIGISVLLGCVAWLVAKAQLRRSPSGVGALVGAKALVRTWNGQAGKVFVRGEIWDATSVRPQNLLPGQTVTITAVAGLLLHVEADAAGPADSH